MVTAEETMSRTDDVPTGEEVRDAPGDTSRTTHRTITENPTPDTDALITLVRRAPALAALHEQPLDRRDLEARLGVSKPTVHRLTRTLDEMGLVERSNGVFVLTGLGETVAGVVAEFTGSVDTAYRLTPLLTALEDRYPAFDIAAFVDATVTTAGPGDPYRPMRRYYSLIKRTDTLRGFDSTALSPGYVDTLYRQVREGLATEFVCQPDAAIQLLSAHPDRTTEMVETGNLSLRIHADLPHGLAIFDERVAVTSYCETTGALRTVVDANSSAAREWAEGVYADYRAEATDLSEHPELSRLPPVRTLAAID